MENLLEREIFHPDSEQAFANLIRQVAAHFRMEPADLKLSGKTPNLVRAKSIICHVAVRHLGIKGVDVGQRLAISPSAVSHAIQRGARLLSEDPALAARLKG